MVRGRFPAVVLVIGVLLYASFPNRSPTELREEVQNTDRLARL
jgi:hypothetical protein